MKITNTTKIDKQELYKLRYKKLLLSKEDKAYIEQIIAGCERGDVRFQEKLYKHFYGYALTISRLYCNDEDDAVTIINDSFLKIFSSLEQKNYIPQNNIKFWIRKIVINTAIDQYRKELKSLKTIDLDEIHQLQSFDESAVSRLSTEEIVELVQQLPIQHKMVFLLYEIQGFSHTEIASKLTISTSSSRVFLGRAKKKLQTLIQQNYK